MKTFIKNPHFASRREDLMAQMGGDSIAIVPGGREQVRSRDTHYPFRQDSNFRYLCGFPEPDALLVLVPGRAAGASILFCRDKDREREIWDGFRFGPEGAVENFEVDDAFPIADIDEILPGLLEGKEKVYYSMGLQPDLDQRLLNWIKEIRTQSRTGASAPGEFVDIDRLLNEMRLIKSAPEIKEMRRVAQVSADAHAKGMRACKPGMYEYQLQTLIESEFFYCGAESVAYTSIVGGGNNACVLHYIENRDALNDGDLVLIDAGAEMNGYAADITRTYPVNGRFSPAQRALYELVLDAQQQAIAQCQVGKRFIDPHQITVRVITAGLIELGLLNGDLEELITRGEYRRFYMHRAGHWLGLDVHDVGDYKVDGNDSEWREFEPGMVTTIEPGIYVHADDQSVDPKWRGIGIRIEDDIVITTKGPLNLTASVPTGIEEIEQLMAGA